MAKDKLTAKQKKFIAAYTGNATQAAKDAGYSEHTAHAIGQENLKKPAIAEALQKREVAEIKRIVMTRLDRQEMWSKLAADEKLDVYARLRASELLGKSEADFTEKHVVEVNVDLGERLQEAIKRREGK